jgi:hypothetical protein
MLYRCSLLLNYHTGSSLVLRGADTPTYTDSAHYKVLLIHLGRGERIERLLLLLCLHLLRLLTSMNHEKSLPNYCFAHLVAKPSLSGKLTP